MRLLAWVRAEALRLLWKRGLYKPPDREVLERDILQPLGRDPSIARVLFVGVEWYTTQYPRFFAEKTFVTIDADPAVAPLGAPLHVVGGIQDLASHCPGQLFDAVVMTGVIGYGLNNRREVDRAIDACAEAIRPGGWLILGIDELRPAHVDPGASPAAEAFEPRPFGGCAPRVDVAIPFKERRHTFLFWKKKDFSTQGGSSRTRRA